MLTLIKNVKIVLPDKILEGHSVVVNEGKISNILANKTIDDANYDNVIHGENNYLSPGFIDIHTHGNSGYDILDSTTEAIDNISKYNLLNGVTSFLGTIITSSYSETVNAINNIGEYIDKKKESTILGIHLEGPFFNIIKKGAQPEEYIRKPDFGLMTDILNRANENIKMVSIAPELEGALDIIKMLDDKGITVAMGHTNATYDEAMKGINEGITVSTHLFNGMRSFTHRDPGVIGASLLDDRVYCEIIADRIHLHDATILMTVKIKGYDKVILVSDSMMASGLKDGEYLLGGQIVIVNEGIARLESGNLAGSTTNLRKSVYNMIHFLNIPICEVVKMASLNPAKAINVHKYKGSIEIGKDADLIIFDEDINIKMTMIKGKIF